MLFILILLTLALLFPITVGEGLIGWEYAQQIAQQHKNYKNDGYFLVWVDEGRIFHYFGGELDFFLRLQLLHLSHQLHIIIFLVFAQKLCLSPDKIVHWFHIAVALLIFYPIVRIYPKIMCLHFWAIRLVLLSKPNINKNLHLPRLTIFSSPSLGS